LYVGALIGGNSLPAGLRLIPRGSARLPRSVSRLATWICDGWVCFAGLPLTALWKRRAKVLRVFAVLALPPAVATGIFKEG